MAPPLFEVTVLWLRVREEIDLATGLERKEGALAGLRRNGLVRNRGKAGAAPGG